MDRSNQAGGPRLVRELGLFDSTAIVVGVVIGSGIFLVPSDVARVLASPGSAMLVWLAGGALSLFGALSLAELNAMYPGAGGLYTFLRQAYGDRAGFLYTWAFLLIMNTGSLSALAVAFGLYSAELLPLGAAGQKAVAVGVVLVLTGVNSLGVRTGKWVQNIFTLAKLAGIGLLCALVFAQRSPLEANAGRFWPAGGWEPTWLQFGIALVAVMWAFEGWAWVSFSGGEMKNPVRDLPRALFFGTLILAAVYLTASTAYYSVLTVEEVAGAERVATATMTQLLGPVAAGLIALLILVSIFGSLNGSILTSTRCYYAIAVDGLFFSAFARLHPRTRVPLLAILVQGLWGATLVLLGTFQQLFTAVIFTSWISYAAVVAAVVVLRHKQRDRPRPYRVPGYPWLPALFVLAALGIVASALVSQPLHAGLAFLLILSGLPVYALLQRSRKRKPTSPTR
ncbi:MAG: amino acid permease [Candidatus Acidoferrales bacterium]